VFETQLGSPCVYSSLSARALDASVVVGSKVGSDLRTSQLGSLEKAGVDTSYVHRIKGRTTAFRIDYENNVRSMWVISRCRPLTRRDLTNLPKSTSIHLGPILNEIPQPVAMWLTERGAVMSLDAQGFMRKTLRDGRVSRVVWRNRRLLNRLDVLKVSQNEAAVMLGEVLSIRKLKRLGPDVVLVTKAGSGTTMWSREQGLLEVPAFKTKVRDSTGSGDALVGAMLVTWARTGDLLWAVAVGSAVASFVVERVSPKNFGTSKLIEERAGVIVDRVKKIHS